MQRAGLIDIPRSYRRRGRESVGEDLGDAVGHFVDRVRNEMLVIVLVLVIVIVIMIVVVVPLRMYVTMAVIVAVWMSGYKKKKRGSLKYLSFLEILNHCIILIFLKRIQL